MKSIRSRLLLTLLPTLMLIWLLSSWAIYLNTRNSLYSGLDQALNLLANDAPFLGGRPKGGNPRLFRNPGQSGQNPAPLREPRRAAA